VSAAEAFAAVRAEPCRQAFCDGPRLRVTAMRLGTVPAQTAHGWASVPAWLLTIEGTPVAIARIAVALDTESGRVHENLYRPDVGYVPVHRGMITTPATTNGSNDNPSATALVVEFFGLPPGTGPSQRMYTAHVVEGASAVVVVVQPMRRQPREQPPLCAPVSLFGPSNSRPCTCPAHSASGSSSTSLTGYHAWSPCHNRLDRLHSINLLFTPNAGRLPVSAAAAIGCGSHAVPPDPESWSRSAPTTIALQRSDDVSAVVGASLHLQKELAADGLLRLSDVLAVLVAVRGRHRG